MDDFLVRALVGGLGVASVAGAFGCFVVWRRMAYFGATLAHSALLGVALGFLMDVAPAAAVIAVSVVVAALLVALKRQRGLATDTLLGILAHAALALGLVAVAFLETVRIDLMAYLFGDILAITEGDIAWIYLAGAAALGVLAVLWRPLLVITIDEDLARTDGLHVTAHDFAFMLLMALVIATGMKIVGILLIVSLLIIPAATARWFARTPEQMALLAAGAGCAAVAGGLWGSVAYDLPAGPAIVVAASVLFAASVVVPLVRARR